MKFFKAYRFSLSVLCFVGLLAFAYIQFVSSQFEYAGFEYVFSFSKSLFTLVIGFIFTIFVPKQLKNPSDLYVHLLFFIVFIPFALLFALGGQDSVYFYHISAGLATIFCIQKFAPRFSLAKTLSVRFSYLFMFLVFLAFGGYFLQVVLAKRLWVNFSLLDVYQYREESARLVDIGILSYLNVWLSKVVLPTSVALCVWYRRYKATALFCLLSVLLFGITQHKSIIFYPYLIIILLVLFRERRGLWIVPSLLAVFCLLVLVVGYFSDNILLPSMFIRRLFFVPAYLTYRYHEFFSANEFVFWSSSFMEGFIDYPYHISTSKLIGKFMGTDASANNGFLATGFMHAGYIGLYVYCVMVGFIFKLIDSLAWRRIPIILAVALTFVPMFSLLTSADLLTSITTHGLGLSLLLLYFLRSSSVVRRISPSS